ncbi:MAG: efflux RND transporter periplasmic adaptor subunit [Myxococcota bacterium]|nr:efflux RND transporter periplasmic adaptor subunit [Myxococcota bacterium]
MNRKRLTPVFIVVVGFSAAGFLFATGPKVEPRSPERVPPLVRTLQVQPETVRLEVSTHGTVMPRTESDLVPEVSGRVVWRSPELVSGGFFDQGDVLLRIDPLDYELGLEQARADVARARSELTNARRDDTRQQNLKAQGVASDAQREDASNRLAVAEASLRVARAALARAERDLERTEMIAPYPGRVRTERVDVGQFIARGTPVATLYAVDRAEVRLPIHDEELAFLDIPEARGGSELPASVPVLLRARFAGAEHEWQGNIVRTEGELDPQTRMVHVIAEVDDPYASGPSPPLAVGLFVEAHILGTEAENVVILPRSSLRGEEQVLVVDEDNRLRYRKVELLRIDAEQILVREGLASGERVCISALESATDGMLVRVQVTETGGEAS